MSLLVPGTLVQLQPGHLTAAHKVHASNHLVRVSEIDRRARQASSTSVFRVCSPLDDGGSSTDRGVSFESLLYEGHYMVHASGQHVEIGLGDACGCEPGTFRTAATFLATAGEAGGSSIQLRCKDDPDRRLTHHGCFVAALPVADGQIIGSDSFVVDVLDPDSLEVRESTVPLDLGSTPVSSKQAVSETLCVCSPSNIFCLTTRHRTVAGCSASTTRHSRHSLDVGGAGGRHPPA